MKAQVLLDTLLKMRQELPQWDRMVVIAEVVAQHRYEERDNGDDAILEMTEWMEGDVMRVMEASKYDEDGNYKFPYLFLLCKER